MWQNENQGAERQDRQAREPSDIINDHEQPGIAKRGDTNDIDPGIMAAIAKMEADGQCRHQRQRQSHAQTR